MVLLVLIFCDATSVVMGWESCLRFVDRIGDGEVPFKGELDGDETADMGVPSRGLRRANVPSLSELVYMNWLSLSRPSKLGVPLRAGAAFSILSLAIVAWFTQLSKSGGSLGY
jgi:hypothetical protein